MASPRDVRDWCRAACATYPNVEIKNMSTSFRDGLAFCAIIHRHRPDLIDFSSLCKDNVYQNNKMAFEIAERRLGIPALLDPGAMVSTKEPDCLSVITYLSRFYCFFNRKSQGGLSTMPPLRYFSLNALVCMSPLDFASQTDLETSREVRLSNTRPGTVCHVCFKPVHLIQRHLTDGKVFHRSCFRESKERSGELKDRDSAHHILKPPSPRLPPSRVKDGTVKRAEPVSAPAEGKIQREGTETRGTSELSSPCARVTEGSCRPVAAPRRMLDSSGVPVPAPRTRAAQPEVSSPSAGERPRLLLTAADTFFRYMFACRRALFFCDA
uniref:Calponin-homology (CH) domain-containing protein n=1 Tax=Gasterosteus aculeatus aculeatus TaxID=481459 RepID=G3NWK9_GASAC